MNLKKLHERLLPSRRTTHKEAKMGVAIGSDGLIAINGQMTRRLIETTPWIDDRPIAFEGSRCDHIARVRRDFI